MQKHTLWIGAALVLVVGGYLGYQATVSDETRVANALDAAVRAFNGRNASGCMDVLATNYRHQGQRDLDRNTLSRGLRWAFAQSGLGNTGRQLKMRLPREQIEIGVDEKSATSQFELLLDSRTSSTAEWSLQWHLKVTATWQNAEDGWRILRSRAETVAGSPPR